MRYLIAFLLISNILTAGMTNFNTRLETRNIAVYQQEPIASKDCAEAVQKVLKTKYSNVFIISHDDCTSETFATLDCIVFPGGEKDVDNFDTLIKDKSRLVRNFVGAGGKYLGICMGAYIAGPMYFNILGATSAEQYVKEADSEITTEKETIADIYIANKPYSVYFYDGPVFKKYLRNKNILARYKNKQAACIIKQYKQGKVLCVGPHLESEKNWYTDKKYWHAGLHHKLLLDMVDKLFKE